jgi:foldase protein PrsA
MIRAMSFLAAALLAAAVAAEPPAVPPLPTLKDVAPETVVVVNGTPVSRESLAALAVLLNRDMVLDTLITAEVVRQEAVRRGLTLTPEEIDAAALKATSEELDAYAQRMGGKSLADLVARGKVTAERAAAERVRLAAWYRPMVTHDLMVDKMVLQDLTVTEADVRGEFERQYGPRARVQQIVLRTREEAEEALNRINAGADFAQLARDVSIDRVSGAKGGVLPPQPARGSPLGEAAFALRPGQIAPIVQTPNGFHVVKVIELIPADKKSFEDVREALRQDVTARLLRERRAGWKRELRAKSTILPSLDVTGAKPNAN